MEQEDLRRIEENAGKIKLPRWHLPRGFLFRYFFNLARVFGAGIGAVAVWPCLIILARMFSFVPLPGVGGGGIAAFVFFIVVSAVGALVGCLAGAGLVITADFLIRAAVFMAGYAAKGIRARPARVVSKDDAGR